MQYPALNSLLYGPTCQRGVVEGLGDVRGMRLEGLGDVVGMRLGTLVPQAEHKAAPRMVVPSSVTRVAVPEVVVLV